MQSISYSRVGSQESLILTYTTKCKQNEIKGALKAISLVYKAKFSLVDVSVNAKTY